MNRRQKKKKSKQLLKKSIGLSDFQYVRIRVDHGVLKIKVRYR